MQFFRNIKSILHILLPENLSSVCENELKYSLKNP